MNSSKIPSITFITGKGGVGKTFVAQLMLRQFPELRLEEHYSKSILTEEFLKRTLKSSTIAKFLSQSSVLQNLLSLAPNLEEILLARKWIEASEERSLLIDSPSTGNFISIFEALKTATQLFDGGSLKKLAEESLNFFGKENMAQVIIVSIPEVSSLEESHQIDIYISQNFPEMKRRHFLNRKHQDLSVEVARELPPLWAALAQERFARENDRLKNLPFSVEKIIFEGRGQ